MRRSETPPHVAAQATDDTSAARRSRWLGVSVVGWTLAAYGLTYLVVRQHYQEYPPHFDSIGLFSAAFEIFNAVPRQPLGEVVRSAFFAGLTWLQPAYALAFSWAPIKSPAGLVSLNFVLLLAAQATILTYGRTFGYGPVRQAVAALVPLAPGALYAWDGGIQDLRRDAQLALLALAILFLSLAYVTQPSWRRGAALGLLVGVAQWSRDNAAVVVAIVAAPAIVVALTRSRARGGIRPLLRLGLLPFGVFLLLAAPYYAATLPLTLERYRASVWGVGESRVESVLAFWNMPFNVLLGGDSRLSGRVRVALVTLALLLATLTTTYGLWRARLISVDRRQIRLPGYALLLASGLWIVVAVFLYNTVVLGYGARWHGVPFLPILVGLVAMMVSLTGAVQRAPRANDRTALAVVAVAAVVLLLSAPLRMVLNQPKADGVEGIVALRAATSEIGERAGGQPVGFLANDVLSRHHLRFYAAWDNRPGVVEFERLAVANGDPIDLDQPLRDGDDPALLQQRLERTLRRWAAYALVYADTARYADPRETLWPYLIGRPVVDRLLSDPGWRPVARYTLRERELVLLENAELRSASAALRSRP